MKKIFHHKLAYFDNYHILIILMIPLIFILLSTFFKNKSKKTQKLTLYIICAINIVSYLISKFDMATHYDDFKIIENLPLHLCNINLIIIPIALFKNCKRLYAYFFYTGIIAALIAIITFDGYFLDRQVFSFSVMVYFYYHIMLVILPMLIVSAKLYTPAFKDILPSILLLLGLAFIMFIFNLTMIYIFKLKECNYFYTMGLKGNPLGDVLWKLVPKPFLFLLPVTPILYIVNCIMTLPFITKKNNNNT